MKMQEILEYAIENGQAKWDNDLDGAVIINTRKFMNSAVLDALFVSMKDKYEFYRIFDGIVRAMPKG